MRDDFPFFNRNKSIVYLDTAATSQTLYTVLEDTTDFYTYHKSNAHRSGHSMDTWVDQKYYLAKEKVAKYVGVAEPDKSIVFTSGATQGLHDAVKLIEKAMPGGTLYLGIDAHHSLSLPIMELAKNNPWWTISYINLNSQGMLDLDALEQTIKADTNKCKVIAVGAVSNVLGKENDLARIKDIAHANAANTIIDAAQLVGKRKVNLSGFDFVAWSWHKVYGPTGLGCLVIDPVWLSYKPVHPGGGSVVSVSYADIIWQENAGRFESGTQNLAGIVTIPRLIDWLESHSSDIEHHDKSMARLANANVPVNQFHQASESDTGLLSLLPVAGAVEDYVMLLDAKGVMVRGGKLCAQPLVDQITSNSALLRLSWGCYTTANEIESTFDKLGDIHAKFQRNVLRPAIAG